MQDETDEVLSLPLPSGTRQSVENWCALLGTVSRALSEHYGIAPSAYHVEVLADVIGGMRSLLELSDAVSRESVDGTAMGRPEAHRQDESWRGQESGRSDNVPERGQRRYGAYRQLSQAKAQAKAAFKKGLRSRKRRKRVRR